MRLLSILSIVLAWKLLRTGGETFASNAPRTQRAGDLKNQLIAIDIVTRQEPQDALEFGT